MKNLYVALLVLFAQACTSHDTIYWEEPNYNHLASHISVIKKTSNFVTYEYKDVRVDEVAPLAALYCQDQGGKQAALYEITMHQNNSRRATFVCKKINGFD